MGVDVVLLDEDKACEMLGGISPKTLQSWRLRGFGPRFFKIGRLVRYDADVLKNWVKNQQRQSTSDIGEQ